MSTQPPQALSRLAPRYSYGRHKGPFPRFCHRAAVLVGVVPCDQFGWSIPLTLRSSRLADHAGQVSLPGGRAERNEIAWKTATREFEEELGCSTSNLEKLRDLSPLYVYASKHWVTPVAGMFLEPPRFHPNTDEVAEVIMLPMGELLRPDAVQIAMVQRATGSFEAPGFMIQGHFVWGATAMILGEFRAWCLAERKFQ